MKTVRRGEIAEFIPASNPYMVPVNSDDLVVDEDTGETHAILAVDPPLPTEEAWRQRANEYPCRYKGPEVWCRFIRIVAATGSLEFAMQQTAVSRAVLMRKRVKYALFDRHLIEAQDSFKSAVLERAAVTRAVDGTLEPVFHKGRIVGWISRKSDSLLIKLLEGAMPEKYKQRVEHSAAGALKVVIEGGLPQPVDEPLGGPAPLLLEHEPTPG